MSWLRRKAQKARMVMGTRMRRHDDRREWAFGGHEITRLLVDNRFEIEVWWKDADLVTTANFTIEAPFTISTENAEHACDPEVKASLTPALALVGRPIESVAAFRNGLLRFRFTDGSELRVPKRTDEFETWQSSGTGELHDIGMLCSSHEVSPWGGRA